MFEKGTSQKELLLSLLKSLKLIFEMQSSIKRKMNGEEGEQQGGYKNKCFESDCTQQKHTNISIKGYDEDRAILYISFTIKSKISHKCCDSVAMV